jgi:hypothetical protein
MITKKDILEALGGAQEDRFMTGMLVGVGVGALVGGIVALLFAPRSGAEIRGTIREKGGNLVDRIRNRGRDELGINTGEVGVGTGTPPYEPTKPF